MPISYIFTDNKVRSQKIVLNLQQSKIIQMCKHARLHLVNPVHTKISMKLKRLNFTFLDARYLLATPCMLSLHEWKNEKLCGNTTPAGPLTTIYAGLEERRVYAKKIQSG